MRYFQASARRMRILYSWPAVVLLALLLVLGASSLRNLIAKSRHAATVAQEAQVQAAVLAARERELKRALSELKTAEGEELYIRATYPVAKEGESVIQVIVDEPRVASSTREREAMWWQFWR